MFMRLSGAGIKFCALMQGNFMRSIDVLLTLLRIFAFCLTPFYIR